MSDEADPKPVPPAAAEQRTAEATKRDGSVWKFFRQYVNLPVEVRKALVNRKEWLELLVRLGLIPVGSTGEVIAARVGVAVLDPT
jgi:hypothetical protein